MNTTNTLFRFVNPDGERRRFTRSPTIAAALLSATAILAPSAAVSSEANKPMDGMSLDLGSFHGSAYYTVENDDDHLVVTLARMNGEEMPGEPLRFETVLPPGGSATISTPQAGSQQSIALTVHRVSDGLVWSEGAGAAAMAQPIASQAHALPAIAREQPATPSPSELYGYLHDPVLHQPDGLGSYGQDFRAAYPN
jgi:hypothetical protein